MTVLDLGGTVDFWQDGTIKPARVVLLNTYESNSGPDPTLEVVQGDACMLPAALRGQRFDVVLSNSKTRGIWVLAIFCHCGCGCQY